MTTAERAQPDATALRECLDNLAREVWGKSVTIDSTDRRRSENASSYDAYVITLHLSSGESRQVFMKDFSFSGRPKSQADQRRDRELRVYRDLLAHAGLGTPNYYGSVWDEKLGRHWLFLEFVLGTEVRYHDVEYWIAAAGWVGRLQGHFAQKRGLLESCDFLQRHDAAFFRSRAQLALKTVSETAPALALRLESIVNRYEGAAGTMASQPLTLVHGAYRPQNILVSGDPGRVTVCPTDWERAALGATLYDLAVFCDGFQPPVLDRMWEAYRQGAQEYGVSVPNREDATHITDCFRMHRVMNWLSLSSERGYPQRDIVTLVELGERLAGTIL